MGLKNTAVGLTVAMQRRLVPELRYSQTQFEERLREYVPGATSWLDVGCGHQLLPPWREEAEEALVASCPLVVGIDYDFESLKKHRTFDHVLRGDVSALPFPDASFDLVTANMVVEHLSDPGQQFREIARVLRPNGVFLFHTPNALSYPVRVSRRLPDAVKRRLALLLEGRAEEDVFPTFYRANDADALHEIAAGSGLAVEAIHFTGSMPVTSVIPPLAAVELLWLRQLMRRPALAKYRQTIICAMRRVAAPSSAGAAAPSVAAATAGGQ
jgi:SAM-dependent methyltransferase